MYAVYSCAPSMDGSAEHTEFTSSLIVAENIAQDLREQGLYVAIYKIAKDRAPAAAPTNYAFTRSN